LSLVVNIERGQSGSTLQRQLYAQIRDSILSATFRPGMSLPSSRKLADDLGVSRNTVMLAYEWLINEGYIDTQPGVGTFVTKALPENCIAVAAEADGKTSAPASSVRRPRIIFRGERHRIVEKGPGRPSIDFWYGSPNWRHFPTKAWRQLLIDNLSRTSTNLSQYASPSGNLELRQAIAQHLGANRGIRAGPEQVIITAGAQEGLNLICRLLVEPGVRVVVESPCYGGAARTFQSYGAVLAPVEVDNYGIDVAALENERANFAYVTPSNQFPTGVTLTNERRGRLLNWAAKVGAYILEDDYDSDFRYDGPPLAALAGIDRNGCVIYLGTFSKSIGAGLRLGFLVVPEHLVETMLTIKSLANYGHPWLDQIVMAEFIVGGGYARHLRRIRQLYRSARDALLSSLEHHFGKSLYISGKYSGMHLMWTLPRDLGPADRFAAKALAQDVGVYPLNEVGAIDFSGRRQAESIVLGYSSLSPDQIETGIKRVAEACFGPTRNRRAS
jgi:GntR family transcriptional regulator / MocR family aminotransferase